MVPSPPVLAARSGRPAEGSRTGREVAAVKMRGRPDVGAPRQDSTTGAFPMISPTRSTFNLAAPAPPDGIDRKASDRARRAAEARARSGRRRFVDPATCERDYSSAEW